MASLEDRLATSVKECGLAGGVAATSDGGVRVVAATGVLDRTSGEAMTVSTPVRIASVTKPMVAAAVVLAAREVPELLDRPVLDYLPDLRPDWRVSPELTLRRLLSQTSGLGEELDRELLEALGDGADAQFGAARLTVGRSQVAPIGSTWSYYNPNYFLAGAAEAAARLVRRRPDDLSPWRCPRLRVVARDRSRTPARRGGRGQRGHRAGLAESVHRSGRRDSLDRSVGAETFRF